MKDKQVTIYISENNSQCNKLLQQMEEWNVPYETKNVSKDSKYMRELQGMGIYGTPATFINEDEAPVLGYQKNRIKSNLGLGSDGHYDASYNGYSSY
ncbi:glutaredoxin family protein [Virgibacillus xinjiangensis]|uniref:Glutaredoxin family protein n=1 Tax=Virgibacillus xinjiangensis TaxID=393090 RepID=A0ABV7CSD5_9BACI